RSSGTPHSPKPPIINVAPSGISRTAAFALSTILLTGTLFCFLRVQGYFLDSPVIHIGGAQRILPGTRHAVGPDEFLHVATGLSENAENLSIQTELIHTAGFLVGGVEILRRAVGHAEGPGLGFVRRIRV